MLAKTCRADRAAVFILQGSGEEDLTQLLSKWIYNKYVPLIQVELDGNGPDANDHGAVVVSQVYKGSNITNCNLETVARRDHRSLESLASG